MTTFKALKQNLSKEGITAFPALKVALLGDTATQFLSTSLQGVAIERGYRLEVFEAEYNQVERQFLDPSANLHTFHGDYTVVFQSSHKLLAAYNLLPPEERHTLADKRLAFVQSIADTYPGRLIYGNYPELDDGVFGSFANKQEQSFIYQIRKLNYSLMQTALRKPNVFIWDLAALQHTLGRSMWFDTALYVSADMVLSLDALPAAASRIMDVICAAEGQIKKCLILDLDNTLWGGVIGDDGLENIQLGHGLGIGKVFTELQHWIKKLKDRGIILAVCSKNDEVVAKEPFERHPGR
ncbi:hypothetical protein Holit_01720 [Hollandina sp. SP2]